MDIAQSWKGFNYIIITIIVSILAGILINYYEGANVLNHSIIFLKSHIFWSVTISVLVILMLSIWRRSAKFQLFASNWELCKRVNKIDPVEDFFIQGFYKAYMKPDFDSLRHTLYPPIP